jgi:copper oxidase (laccase) domain-containing protein
MDANITEDPDIQWVQNADGLITEKKNIALGAYGADCCIIAFWDEKNIGICHAGWRGFLNGILEQMLKHFETEKVACHIGPFLHSFEIQRDSCYESIVQKYGNKYFEYTSGKIIFHFKSRKQFLKNYKEFLFQLTTVPRLNTVLL